MSQQPGQIAPRLALAAVALGLGTLGALSLASGDFAYQWQPVPPDVPAREMLARTAGALEILAAVLLVPAGLRARGAWAVAAILLGWTALHVPSVAQRPGSVADWLGIAETGAMASAALARAAGATSRDGLRRAAAVAFGLCAMVFGLSHFVYADFTASMIPAWLPERLALAWFTGAAHALAGIAIALGIRRVLAAALEAAMMAGFVLLVHMPRVLAQPASRLEWTMLAVAVLLSGSAATVAVVFRRTTAERMLTRP